MADVEKICNCCANLNKPSLCHNCGVGFLSHSAFELAEEKFTSTNSKSAPFYLGCTNYECVWNTRNGQWGGVKQHFPVCKASLQSGGVGASPAPGVQHTFTRTLGEIKKFL